MKLLRDRSLNTETGGMEEKVGGSGIFFPTIRGGLGKNIVLKGGVINFNLKGQWSY